MITHTRTEDERLALAQHGTNRFLSADVLPTRTEPTGTGVHELTSGESDGPNQIVVTPVCGGKPGTRFYVRVWGWKRVKGYTQAVLWRPAAIADLYCEAGDVAAGPSVQPPDAQADLPLTAADNFCDVVLLYAGSVGSGDREGDVVGFGAGSGIAAHAVLDAKGCRKVQFDFAYIDECWMNALWARL